MCTFRRIYRVRSGSYIIGQRGIDFDALQRSVDVYDRGERTLFADGALLIFWGFIWRL